MKSIEKIEILIKPDNDTSSYVEELGRYSNQWGKYAIDRKIRGDQRPREYRYFHPAYPPTPRMTPKERREQWKRCEWDYKRAEDLSNGIWYLMAIRSRATINVNGIINEVHGGCVCGIESDMDDMDIRQIKHEQLQELAEVLGELGFAQSEIDDAVKNAEEVSYLRW